HAKVSNKLYVICIFTFANYQIIADNRINIFVKLKFDGLNVEDKKVRDTNNPEKLIYSKLLNIII
ncbi:NgoPII family restriction endonuclease, partial [Francisella tularensis subsp. holarctica]|nr:NgoPII family restriction endonuclease [Francisella tularensis subsp. holarctica]